MTTKKPGRPPIEGPKRIIPLRVMVTKGEATKIRSKARSLGLTLSEYLRSVAIPKTEGRI
jgi:hypothetical protein